MKNLNIFTNSKGITFTLFLVLLLSACGKNPQNRIVKDVNLESSVIDGDVWVTVKSLVKLGDLSMTSVELPIKNPNNPSQLYGELALRPTLDMGMNEIEIKVNISEAAKIQGTDDPTLPNGESLPLGGTADATLVELPIEQINSKVYFALNRNTVVLGFAIGIKQFDVLRDYIGGANVFLGFNIEQVRGMVGLFAGNDPGTSGLGMFVDLSSVVSPDVINDLIEGGSTQQDLALKSGTYEAFSVQALSLQSKSRSSYTSDRPIRFKTQDLSGRESYRIYRGFRKISRKTRSLTY